MGMFPYECKICGGAYNRCGAIEHNQMKKSIYGMYENYDSDDDSDDSDDDKIYKCSGGQFCWEDEVYFLYKNVLYLGTYNAYGMVYTSDKNGTILIDNNEKFPVSDENGFLANPDLSEDLFVNVWCKSCLDNKYDNLKEINVLISRNNCLYVNVNDKKCTSENFLSYVR